MAGQLGYFFECVFISFLIEYKVQHSNSPVFVRGLVDRYCESFTIHCLYRLKIRSLLYFLFPILKTNSVLMAIVNMRNTASTIFVSDALFIFYFFFDPNRRRKQSSFRYKITTIVMLLNITHQYQTLNLLLTPLTDYRGCYALLQFMHFTD